MMASGAIESSCPRNSSLLRILSGCVTGMPSDIAVCLTGGAASFWERPTGRSGCVTASAISWPARCSASRVGTAKRGVPQKTSFTALPPTFALHLADFAEDHVALQPAHAEDEQRSVQVVDLMLEGARQQFLAVHFEPFAVFVLRADLHLGAADDLLPDFGETQAAFLLVLSALLEGDLRVHQHQFLGGVFSHAEVDHGDALRNRHLRRSEAYALGRVHGLEHVGNELAQLVIEFGYRLAGLLQYRLRVFHDLENHLLKTPDLFDVPIVIPFHFEKGVASKLLVGEPRKGEGHHGFRRHARRRHNANIRSFVTRRGFFPCVKPY